MRNIINATHAVILSFVLLSLQGSAEKQVAVFPAYQITVTTGHDLYMKIVEPITDLQKCVVIIKEEEYILSGTEESQEILGYKYWGTGVASGVCGVMASRLQKEQSGHWVLQGKNSSDTYNGSLDVTVIDVSPHVDVGGTMILGEHAAVLLGPLNIVFCRMKHPSGMDMGKTSQRCRVDLNPVRKTDEGIWSAVYTMTGTMEEFETSALYSVIDKQTSGLKTIVEASGTMPGAIDLLCRLAPSSSLVKCNYCYFEHPNGTGFLMHEGLGNGHYVYYGKGLNNDYKDCGLTILEPSEADSGIWKCELGLEGTSQLRDGGFIFLQKSDEVFPVIQATALSEESVVLNDSSAALGCTVPFMIKACWLRHPTGKILSVSSDGTVSGGYKYYGDSFGLGHCGITLDLHVEDSGQWQCNVALDGSNEGDISVSFTVHVKANKLSVDQPIKEVANEDATVLLCHSTVFQYPLTMCRFIRPDGQGFTLGGGSELIQEKYGYYGNGLDVGDCGLHINSVTALDYGQWTCSVHLRNEQEADIGHLTIYQSQKPISGGAVAGTSVGAIVAVSLIIAVMYFIIYKRRQAHQLQTAVHFQDDSSSNGSGDI